MHHTYVNLVTSTEDFMFRHMLTTSPDLDDFMIHTHDSYELLYLISGNITCHIEGHIYAVQPHDLILTNLRELHKTVPELNGSYERIFIRFRPSFVFGLQTEGYNLFSALEGRKLGYNNRIYAADVAALNLPQDLGSIRAYAAKGTAEDLVMIKVTLTKMLVAMNGYFEANKQQHTSTVKVDETVKAVLEFINGNLAEKLTLDFLEGKFHLSRYHLARIFKQSTGFSINEYITHKRIMKARELMADTNISAQEVAAAVGYNDYSNFYRAFKRILGISPGRMKS